MSQTTTGPAFGIGATGPAQIWGAPLPPDATIQQRLIAILAELPAIGKEAWNEQQKFHYRSHDDVLNALNPLLAKQGVAVIPYVLKRVTGERTTSRGSTMYEVNLHVQYEFIGLAGDSITASAWGEGTDMGDKATNKAMTGAFKNVLAQVFAISTAESYDADGGTPEHTTRGGAPARSRARGPERPAQQHGGAPPAHGLLPGAISGEGAQRRLAEAFHGYDATVDWTATVQPGIKHVFGVESRDEIPQERRAEFWRRMANAEVKLRPLFPEPGAVGGPPVDDAQVLDVLMWAFDAAPIERLVLTEALQKALDAATASGETGGDDPTTTEEGNDDGDATDATAAD